MSNAMTLFGNQSNAAAALLQGIEDNLTDKIAGSGGARRISIVAMFYPLLCILANLAPARAALVASRGYSFPEPITLLA